MLPSRTRHITDHLSHIRPACFLKQREAFSEKACIQSLLCGPPRWKACGSSGAVGGSSAQECCWRHLVLKRRTGSARTAERAPQPTHVYLPFQNLLHSLPVCKYWEITLPCNPQGVHLLSRLPVELAKAARQLPNPKGLLADCTSWERKTHHHMHRIIGSLAFKFHLASLRDYLRLPKRKIALLRCEDICFAEFSTATISK